MEILLPAQAAEELGITEGTVRRICQSGRLGQKLGRQWIITREELEEFKKLDRPTGRPRKVCARKHPPRGR